VGIAVYSRDTNPWRQRQFRRRLTVDGRRGYPRAVIVVIGSPRGRLDGDRISAGGLASLVAIAAASLGRAVQLVGRIGDDVAADAVLQDLIRHGVRHAAILRDPARATPVSGVADGWVDGEPDTADPDVDGADVELALRYLTNFAVIVLTEPMAESVIPVVASAIEWSGAALVVVRPAGRGLPSGLPDDAIFLEPGPDESIEAFATRAGGVAVARDVHPGPSDGGSDRGDELRPVVADVVNES
jgi:pfkB family carbohydrate kinase